MRWEIMGILNVTPDSFSDGGLFFGVDSAISHGQALFDAGADLVDVGGESTRPGALPVPADEELERVLPVVEALAALGRVSIDTRKESVARACVRAGASLINDVSGSLGRVAGEERAGWIAMHAKGDPQTMQDNPYYDDVVGEVEEFFVQKIGEAQQWHVPTLYLDPGIGFGKTREHNLKLLAATHRFSSLGPRLAVGTSRKTFLSTLSGTERPGVEDREETTLATSAWAWLAGASLVRVHLVEPLVQFRSLMRAMERTTE